jgi:hypothetical protein
VSGGSYNYLCLAQDIGDLITHEGDLRDMADRLVGLGYAQDAAKETEELICMLNQAKMRISTRMQRLHDVWRSVEWMDSGDSGEEAVKKSLQRYRGEENTIVTDGDQ